MNWNGLLLPEPLMNLVKLWKERYQVIFMFLPLYHICLLQEHAKEVFRNQQVWIISRKPLVIPILLCGLQI